MTTYNEETRTALEILSENTWDDITDTLAPMVPYYYPMAPKLVAAAAGLAGAALAMDANWRSTCHSLQSVDFDRIAQVLIVTAGDKYEDDPHVYS